MIVMDSSSGKEVAALPTVEGMDGVYFNEKQKRIYISGGRDNDVGYIFIYQQKDADHYEALGKYPRDRVRALPFGHRNLIVFMLVHQRAISKKLRFSYLSHSLRMLLDFCELINFEANTEKSLEDRWKSWF